MNYEGSEEVRKDIQDLTEKTYELFHQFGQFESRYKWNKAGLAERLAGAAVGNIKDELARLYRMVAEIEHQFQD